MTHINKLPESVKMLINEIKDKTKNDNPKWGDVFENGFSNTLEKAINRIDDDHIFMMTGDIPAMWLRDSSAQIRPYLLLASQDNEIKHIIKSVINQQIKYINHDPYANAFNETFNGKGHQSDHTEMTDLIWERKYEIDSLCYPIQLAYLYYLETKDASIFTKEFTNAVYKAIDVWTIEQDHSQSNYTFTRDTDRLEDTLVNEGKGSPVGKCGLSWSGFRPSDDACKYHYLIPSNMFMVVVLRYIKKIYSEILDDYNLVEKATTLINEVELGIKNEAVIKTDIGPIYAYEVDGLGNYSLMDDPNVPSLLSVPYLGYVDIDNVLYQNTRNFILSDRNPYYYEGEFAKGCGSSHTPVNYIWPIALAIQGLTTNDQQEKKELLNTLVACDGDTLAMHESFDVNDPNNYTREWFSWANMMFCELLLDYYGMKVKI